MDPDQIITPALASTRQMRVAFESVVWGLRIDDLDYMLSVLQACGYQGVEIAQSPKNIFVRDDGTARPIGDIDHLIERCERYGLTLTGLVGGTLEERVAYIGKRRDVYLYLDTWPENAWKYLVQPDPIRLAVHPHWFMPIRKRKHVEELWPKVLKQVTEHYISQDHSEEDATLLAAAACKNLRLIVDTAHAVIAEDDPVKFVTDHAEKLDAVHIKGWRPDFGRWSHRYPKGFCIPSAGIVPVEAVMDALTAKNFDGWIVLEQDYFERSRENTALQCAQWLAGHGARWPISLKIDASTVNALTPTRPPNPFREAVGALNALEMARAFAASPSTTSESFYRNAVTTLSTLLKAEYVKLWSYNPTTEAFYLLDAVGVNGAPVECESVLSQSGTLAGKVATTPSVSQHDLHDQAVKTAFADKGFLQKVQSRWMVCVPVFNASNPHHLRAMFSVFTNQDFRGGAERLLELLSHVIALWADYVGGEVCAAAGGATNYLSGEVKTGVVAYVDALHDHLIKAFDCENVSIFLRDASRTRLEPSGKCASRIQWRADLAPPAHFYGIGEGLTGKVWAQREMLFSDDAKRCDGYAGKSREIPVGGREEILFAPLARLNGEVLGVVRLRNKRAHLGTSASTMFTDDDAAKLDSIIQAALPYLELLLTQRQQASSLTRLNHELQNPLIGISGAVHFLRMKMKLKGITDIKQEYGADYLADILSYRDLMSRLALTAKLFGDSFDRLRPEFERCDLATSVVEPVSRQISPLLKRYGLPEGRISIAQFQGVIPWLWVDKNMMQQVFFNLLTNAIKYRDSREDFGVKIEVSAVMRGTELESYNIDVVDWGVGLDDDAEAPQRMFLPGVRGASVAKIKDPAGTGIGLSVVRDIVELHGGTVTFIPNRIVVSHGISREQPSTPPNLFKKPTRVRITLPALLRHGKPK